MYEFLNDIEDIEELRYLLDADDCPPDAARLIEKLIEQIESTES